MIFNLHLKDDCLNETLAIRPYNKEIWVSMIEEEDEEKINIKNGQNMINKVVPWTFDPWSRQCV